MWLPKWLACAISWVNGMQIKLQEADERLEARDRVVSGLHQQLSEKQLQIKKLRSFLKADLHSRVTPATLHPSLADPLLS